MGDYVTDLIRQSPSSEFSDCAVTLLLVTMEKMVIESEVAVSASTVNLSECVSSTAVAKINLYTELFFV